MAQPAASLPRRQRRMGEVETVMWRAENDPVLRPSFTTVTFLDRAPDMAVFRRRMERVLDAVPRLRQRVAEPPARLGPPSWEDDADFDLDHHLRILGLPSGAQAAGRAAEVGAGTGGDDGRRPLLDLAARLSEDPFDPGRPLWRFTVVEGVGEGGAALLLRIHHTISDGMGALRLSALFVDLEREPPQEPVEDGPREWVPVQAPPTLVDMAEDALATPLALGRLLAVGVQTAVSSPALVGAVADSASRQLLVTGAARSPLWRGRASTHRRFETLSFDLGRAKAAAKALGGTLNDLYLTAVAGAAGAYHRAMGAPVDELRASIPISLRSEGSATGPTAGPAGGNAFAPARVLLPADESPPGDRFALVHERLAAAKTEPVLALGEVMAGVLSGLPAPVVSRLVRSQASTVDFAAANLRGSPVEIFVAGAAATATYPMGPTAASAFNATLLSYRSSMDIGINVDTAAVDDPVLLRECLRAALAELMAAAG